GVNEVAATRAATIVIAFGDDLAVAAVVGIAPAHRPSGRAALPGIVFGLAGQLAVARVKVLADGVADDATDHGAGQGGSHLAAALTELVADDGPGDGTDRRAGLLLVRTGLQPERRQQRHANSRSQPWPCHHRRSSPYRRRIFSAALRQLKVRL